MHPSQQRDRQRAGIGDISSEFQLRTNSYFSHKKHSLIIFEQQFKIYEKYK